MSSQTEAEEPLYQTSLSADAMYYHAARRALNRAVELLPKVANLTAQWKDCENKKQAILSKYSGDPSKITNIDDECELERIYVFQGDYLHGQIETAYSPFIEDISVTHILCAASLEAFINMLSDEALQGEAARQFDRLPLEGKWLFLPRLVGCPGFTAGAEPYQSFARLIKYRNNLVHFKSKKDPVEWGHLPALADKLGLTREAGERSLSTVSAMITDFCKQRSEPEPMWLTGGDDTNYFEFSINQRVYEKIAKCNSHTRGT